MKNSMSMYSIFLFLYLPFLYLSASFPGLCHKRTRVFNFIYFFRESKGGAVVRELASHQCGPGSNPGVDAICGLSLLLVLSLSPRGFSPGTSVFPSPLKPTFSNSNSIWNARTRFNEFLRTPKCSVGKQSTIFFLPQISLTGHICGKWVTGKVPVLARRVHMNFGRYCGVLLCFADDESEASASIRE